MGVCVCLCVMCRGRMSICWTRVCMSCCVYRSDWVPKIRDIHHGLLSLVDPLYGTRSDDDSWTYISCIDLIIPSWLISVTRQQLNCSIPCTKSTCMFMSHRQTECHKEGPRGTIVHDEYHVYFGHSVTSIDAARHTHSRLTNGRSHSTHHTQTNTNSHILFCSRCG